jgi:hypothetical protein
VPRKTVFPHAARLTAIRLGYLLTLSRTRASRHFSFANCEHVHAPQMLRLFVAVLAIYPAYDCTITTDRRLMFQ